MSNRKRNRRQYVAVAVALVGGCTAVYLCHAQYRAGQQLEAWAHQQQDVAIVVALDDPVRLPPGELALEEFASRFQKQTGIEVVIDIDALTLAGVTPNSAMVQPLESRLPASSHLTLALLPLELCWIVRDGQAVITSPEKAESEPLVVATYVLPQAEAADSAADARAWAQAITSAIEPHEWDDVGGRGHCAPVGGALVIAHRPEIHRQIRAIFERLRAGGDPPASWQPLALESAALAAANRAALACLQRPAKIDCREMRLQDVVKLLAAEHDVPLFLNVKKLAEASVSPATPVTMELSGVTLESLLRHVLKELELTFVVRHGAVQITTPEDAESQLVLVGYPVHDLVTVRGGRDHDSLIELITSTIKPDSWDDVGGPGCIDYVGGWLLVPQTLEVHQQLEAFLNDLRERLTLGTPTNVFANPRRGAAEGRIAAALDRPVKASYYDWRLSHVATELTSELGVPVRLALKKLEEASISHETPITCDFPIAPARVQLRRLLKPLELTYVVRNEAVLITTPEDTESPLVTRVYDVRPLLDSDVGLFRSGGPLPDADGLIEMITGIINADSWDDVGGPGAIEVFRGLLVVSQTEEYQEEVARFLDELRRAMRWDNQPGVMAATEPSPADQAIAQALEREISLDYDKTPLAEVARDLSQRLGTAVYLPKNKLDEASVSLELPVSGHFPAAPARVQLARLCDQLDLRFIIRDDLLRITTPEDAESQFRTRIYDVRSLIFPPGQIGMGSGDHDTLIELITNHVQADSWDDVGGPGSIDGVRGVMAISHTDEVHREVAALFDALHKLRETRLPGEPELPRAIWITPDAVEERIYERLAEPVNLVPTELRLDRAIAQLSRESGVPMRLVTEWTGAPALVVDPFGSGEIVSNQASEQVRSRAEPGQTLAGVLQRILPEEMQYAVRNRELFITTLPAFERFGRLRLYRVDDLAPSAQTDGQRLRDQMIDNIAPDRWQEKGGPGSISVAQDGWILVTADTVTHEQVDDWLAKRRTGVTTQRARERSELDGAQND